MPPRNGKAPRKTSPTPGTTLVVSNRGAEHIPPPIASRDWAMCGMLAVGVLLAFAPALSADFVRWDDQMFVLDNPNIRGITFEHLEWMFTRSRGGHFHPLTWLSWAIDYELWGGYKPRGFHLTNLLLHGVNAILVFFLLRRLIVLGGKAATAGAMRPWNLTLASAVGAALFAMHPLRAESVAWITERRDVLSAAFLLGSLIAYLRSVRPGETAVASRWSFILSIVLLVLSCLSKGWGMIFFAVLLVLDWYPLRRISLDLRTWGAVSTLRVLAQKAPFAIMGVLTALMAAQAAHSNSAVKSLEEWSGFERAVQAVYGLWFYTRATFFPDKLSPLYQLPARIEPWEPRYVVAYVFVALLIGLIVACRKRFPAISAAGLIYAIILSPVLGLLQSGDQFVADRYSYLACIVYSTLIAGGLFALLRRLREKEESTGSSRSLRFAVLSAAAIVCATLSLLTSFQSAIWTSTESLWAHAIVVEPGSQALVNYAMEVERLGRHDEFKAAIAAAAKLNPTDGRAWFVLGNNLRDSGHPQEAVVAYTQAAKFIPQAYMAYVNIGGVYLNQLDRPADAIAAYRAAVADIEKGGRRQLSAAPYLALGNALRKTGDIEGARKAFSKALTFDETRSEAERELKMLQNLPAASSPPPPDGKGP